MKIHVIITMIALVVFLIAAIWYAKKKYKINLSVLGLGAVAFFVSSQVLEKIVHLLVLHPQKDGTISLMQEHPFLYVLYGIAILILLSLLESSNPDVANLLPKTTLEAVQSLSVWQVYLLGVERILALVIQIGLSFWVYQAVRQKNWIYLVAAYGLHALFDLAPSLSQVGWISNPLIVEGLLAVEVVLFVYFTKSIFYKKQ